MLHAFNQKNVRRVLTNSRNEHVIGKDEDGVTSMAFSPLAFMTADAAAEVLGEIVGSVFNAASDGRRPRAHEILLWPQGLRDTGWEGNRSTRCEPDFIVRFDFDEGSPLAIIGEMKWDWLVGSEHLRAETDRQRRAVKTLYSDAVQIVLTITKRTVQGELPDTVAKTWVDVHRAATALARRNPASAPGRWGRLVADFLAYAEQMDFQGFTEFAQVAAPTSTMFWSAAS
jgi:hypothetical protein